MSEEYVYIIGLGNTEDWDEGRGSLYYIEDKNGRTCIPVFSTPEGVERHIEANFNSAESHMQMMEGLLLSHVGPLTDGRFIIMPVTEDLIFNKAREMGINYLVRDPRPGDQQEVMNVTD
jgi:hypothetical protein